jgi:membrane fusion protein (multidrug efflux system)
MKRSRIAVARSGSISLATPLIFMPLWLMALFLPACQKAPTVGTKPPIVEVEQVVQKDVPQISEWVGVTDGLVNATIRAQVTGYLIRQVYKEGDAVKKGDLLFEIDPRPFAAALGQAQAALDQAGSALNQAEAASDQAKTQVVRAEAQYATDLANLKRVEPLSRQKALSAKDLDDAQGAEQTSKAAVVGAKATVVAAQASIAAARNAISGAKAALEKARLDLNFTKIRSPIDGVAGLAKAQTGDLAGPAQAGELTTVSTVDPIKVYFSVSEQEYLRYIDMTHSAAGATGSEHASEVVHELYLSDGSRYPYDGRFYAADRQVDARTGTLRIAVLFPNPGNLLRPGQFARVRAALETNKATLLVPQRAIAELQGGYQVAVLGPGNSVDIRQVQPGERVGTLQVVRQGLKSGDQVVVEGVQKVRQGMVVSPKPFAAAPESPVKPAGPNSKAGGK